MPKSYNSFYRSWVSLLVGTSGTIVGASLFNVLSDIKGYIFKSQEMLVLTLLAVYFTFVSFSSVLYIFVNVATHGFLLLGLIGNTVLAALIPTICFLNNVSYVVQAKHFSIHLRFLSGTLLGCCWSGFALRCCGSSRDVHIVNFELFLRAQLERK